MCIYIYTYIHIHTPLYTEHTSGRRPDAAASRRWARAEKAWRALLFLRIIITNDNNDNTNNNNNNNNNNNDNTDNNNHNNNY